MSKVASFSRSLCSFRYLMFSRKPEYEYEYYYEYYDEENDTVSSSLINSIESDLTTAKVTTTKLNPTISLPSPTKLPNRPTPRPRPTARPRPTQFPGYATTTRVSYVDGNYLDSHRSVVTVDTAGLVGTRRNDLKNPMAELLGGSTDSSFPFHPDRFDPEATFPRNPNDPKNEAVNWYFSNYNSDNVDPFVDPQLAEKRERSSSSSGKFIAANILSLVMTSFLINTLFN